MTVTSVVICKSFNIYEDVVFGSIFLMCFFVFASSEDVVLY
jgi:hypothetical protein